MSKKNPTVEALEVFRSAIAQLDPRGDNRTVTLAMVIGAVAVEHLEEGKPLPSAQELYALAVESFATSGDEL